MKKDFEEVKKELEDRINLKKKELLDKQTKIQEEQEKRAEIKKLLEQEENLNKELNKNSFYNKLIKYVIKNPEASVFHVGAVIMMFMGEWLPFAFCLVFPIFIPMIKRSDKNARKKQ